MRWGSRTCTSTGCCRISGAEGLISLRGKTLKVLDWEGLKKAGEFDPTYLHLVKKEAL